MGRSVSVFEVNVLSGVLYYFLYQNCVICWMVTVMYQFCWQYSSEEEEEDLNATAAGIANKQKKELAKVDHSNMKYTEFRKNFYVEVPDRKSVV
jgi:hypothetical protein